MKGMPNLVTRLAVSLRLFYMCALWLQVVRRMAAVDAWAADMVGSLGLLPWVCQCLTSSASALAESMPSAGEGGVAQEPAKAAARRASTDILALALEVQN